MSLYLVDVRYEATDRSVVTADDAGEARRKATEHYQFHEDGPRVVEVMVTEVVAVASAGV